MGREGETLQGVPGTDLFSVNKAQIVTARVMAILSQLVIVLGMMLVGLRHFDNIHAGIAAATLYLLLPYTAMWTGGVTHALPAALLVWAVVLYRRPLFSGAMIGLAFGTIYYPLFLLPLWISFYWQKGVAAIPARLRGNGRGAGRYLGLHVERPADVPGQPEADVWRAIPRRRATCAARGNSGTRSTAIRSSRRSLA